MTCILLRKMGVLTAIIANANVQTQPPHVGRRINTEFDFDTDFTNVRLLRWETQPTLLRNHCSPVDIPMLFQDVAIGLLTLEQSY